MTLRPTISGMVLVSLLLLAGCGSDDRPAYTPPDPGTVSYQASPAPTLPPVTPTAAADDDPLAGPDPLAAGAEGFGASPTLALGDPILGRAMPTDYSHWLNVEMYDARVTVRLNGAQAGAPTSVGTTDITMRLHRGPNLLTLTYAPRSARSWASVSVVEGEHHPAIAPLVSFRKSPLAGGASGTSDAAPPAVIKAFTFIAR